jgi:hypothetical protein
VVLEILKSIFCIEVELISLICAILLNVFGFDMTDADKLFNVCALEKVRLLLISVFDHEFRH